MICYKLLYLCHRTNAQNVDIGIYGDPQEYWINYQPVSGYTSVMQYGEKVNKIYRAILNFDIFVSVFKEGDLAYLCGKDFEDGDAPLITTGYVNGRDANAKVISVRNQNKAIEVTFEKIK
jgi:hypothetical protein